MSDSRGEDVFWKWLLAVSLVIIATVLAYALTARQNGSIRPAATTPSLTLGVPDKIALVAPEGKEGSGESERVWDGLEFLLTIQTTLPAPAEGRWYEAWLGDGTTDGDVTKIGRLESDDACSCYRIVYRNDKDQRSRSLVLVSEEEKDDDAPETRLLEGRFPALPGQETSSDSRAESTEAAEESE